MIQIEQSVVLS